MPLSLPLTLPLALSFCFFLHPWELAPPKHGTNEKDTANGNVNGDTNGKKISTTYDYQYSEKALCSLHCWYRYMGLLKKIALGRCVFRTKAPVLMNVAISQQEHQELLLAALAILRVVLRARSAAAFTGFSASGAAASSSASNRRSPKAILANRFCSCATGLQ